MLALATRRNVSGNIAATNKRARAGLIGTTGAEQEPRSDEIEWNALRAAQRGSP